MQSLFVRLYVFLVDEPLHNILPFTASTFLPNWEHTSLSAKKVYEMILSSSFCVKCFL